jgi:hypothetical protein
VLKLAKISQQKNKKAKLLPHPEDLHILSENLIEGIKSVDLTKKDIGTRRCLIGFVQPYLMILNKTRPGEINIIK